MGVTALLELVKKAAPRITVATLRRPRRRQLKPLGSPGERFGLFEGGVEFGESDMMGGKRRSRRWAKPEGMSRAAQLDVVQA